MSCTHEWHQTLRINREAFMEATDPGYEMDDGEGGVIICRHCVWCRSTIAIEKEGA